MRTLDLRRRGNRQTGFTLLEVLIAMGILAVVGTFIALTLNRSNTTLHESQTLSDAQVVANNVVEDIRGKITAGQPVCAGATAHNETVNGVTYHPVVTITPVKVSKSGAQDVACNNATAIKVNVDVQWQGQGKSGTLKSPVSTMLNLVKLTRPAFVGLQVSPHKIAQGQTYTATWTEPGTLPVPQYMLTEPANSQPTNMPSTSLTFQGPQTNVQRQALADQADANVTVEATGDAHHDRAYTFRFTAQRNGTHTFSARNIVGNAVATADVNTIMKPSLTVAPAKQAIDYDAKPSWTIQALYAGNDTDAYITIGEPGGVTTTYKSPNIRPDNSLGVQQVPSRVTTFPVTYPITIHNLWTKTYNTEVTQNVTVTCKLPAVDLSQSTLTVRQGTPLHIVWKVANYQAPFQKVVIAVHGMNVPIPPGQQALTGSVDRGISVGQYDVTAYAVTACGTGPVTTAHATVRAPSHHKNANYCHASISKTYDLSGNKVTDVNTGFDYGRATNDGYTNFEVHHAGNASDGVHSGWDTADSGSTAIGVWAKDTKTGKTVMLCEAAQNNNIDFKGTQNGPNTR